MKIESLFLALGVLCLTACQSQYAFVTVTATAETKPVVSAEDAADDPAIWVNTSAPEQSRILGTNKQQGLLVYSLQGEQLQLLEIGRVNNVDLRQGIFVEKTLMDIAVASNRDTNSIDVFTIDEQGLVSVFDTVPTSLQDIYGICSAKFAGDLHVFVNGKSGQYQHWQLSNSGSWAPQLIGSFSLPSQPEGCVVDDETRMLYAGEENAGIWAMPANASKADQKQQVISLDKPYLKADIEGLALYKTDQQTLLVASSQGNNSYAMFDVNNAYQHIASFRVTDDKPNGVDGSQETDGLAVSSANLGPLFPKGILIVQDGENTLPKANQNFKLVDWRALFED